MITSVHDWIRFLNQVEPLAGIPLVVAGVGIMLFGWRLYRVSMAFAFAVVGYGVGVMLGPTSDQQLVFGIVGAVCAACLGAGPVKYAVPLLGGAVGAFAALHFMSSMGLREAPLWVATGVAFIALTALSAINRHIVVVLVSSITGALVLLSGLVALTRVVPELHGLVASMSKGSLFVLPFMVLVPTAVSFFYQMGEVRRTGTTDV